MVWPTKNEKVELNRVRGTNFTKSSVPWKLREFRIHQMSVFAVLRRKLQCSSCKDLSKPVFLLWKILSVEKGKIKNSDLIDFRSRRMEMLNKDFEVRAFKYTIIVNFKVKKINTWIFYWINIAWEYDNIWIYYNSFDHIHRLANSSGLKLFPRTKFFSCSKS